MTWQHYAVAGIVAAAVAVVGRAAWRTWFPAAGAACGGCGSGCAPKPVAGVEAFVPSASLGVLRRDETPL